MKHVQKILFQIIFSLTIFSFEIGFWIFLPPPLRYINLTLVLVFLFIFLSKNDWLTFLLIITFGLANDFYSTGFFGSYTLSLLGALAITYWILNNFLTNKTTLSFLTLAAANLISFKIIYFLINIIAGLKLSAVYEISFLNFLNYAWKEIIMDIVILLFLFFLIRIFSKKLKTIFL